LKIKDELIGKEVLDSTGHELGKVDDVDVDFDSDRIDSIILHEGGRLRGRDRVIPYSMVETVGERILLKKSGEREPREETGERREGIM
jgi:sporulation protein YlmC with PRC-barrel domain